MAKQIKSKGKLNQAGQISKTLIILAAIIFVLIIAVFLFAKFFTGKKPATTNNPSQTTVQEPPKPVYETTVGDVKFSLLSSQDLGGILKSNLSYQPDLTTTERFVKVIVGAQNEGKKNIDQYSWDVGDIVDSDGRHFTTINEKAYYFLPKEDFCGALLKPAFDPSPCIKLYEVSKVSTGLKITVQNKINKQQSMLDLNLSQ